MSTNVRFKFKCDRIEGSTGYQDVFMTPIVQPETPDDEKFAQYTPAGSINFRVTNKGLFGYWVPGQYYYFDCQPVPTDQPGVHAHDGHHPPVMPTANPPVVNE